MFSKSIANFNVVNCKDKTWKKRKIFIDKKQNDWCWLMCYMFVDVVQHV